jgi:hypothetical protein
MVHIDGATHYFGALSALMGGFYSLEQPVGPALVHTMGAGLGANYLAASTI